MLNLDVNFLRELGLDPSDLVLLNDEQKEEKIHQRYFKLAFRYHPQNTFFADANRYQRNNQAYQGIFRVEEIVPEINAYIEPQNVENLDSAFGLVQQEDILRAYKGLVERFTGLQDHEKEAFANRYAAFIRLAQALESQQAILNQNRVEYFMQLEQASFWQKYKLQWRKLMITLFAEEYLDDFQYRHALATGELRAILAFRKVLSPVKLVVALINSVFLALEVLWQHFLIKGIFLSVVKDSFRFYADIQRNNSLNKKDVALWVLKLSGIIVGLAGLILSFIFIPLISFTVVSLPVLHNILDILACPVNRIVRPLAQLTHLSPYIVGIVLLLVIGLSIAAFLTFTPITSFVGLVVPAMLLLTAYTLITYFTSLKKMYELNPVLTFFTLSVFISSLVASVGLTLLLPGGIAVAPLANLVTCLFCAYLVDQWVNHIQKSSQNETKWVEDLPLADREPSDALKTTVLQEVKTAHCSATFFNTLKKAEFIPKEERTVLQQTASFFGGGEKKLLRNERPIPARQGLIRAVSLN